MITKVTKKQISKTNEKWNVLFLENNLKLSTISDIYTHICKPFI